MKMFSQKHLTQALLYARNGGQALHVCKTDTLPALATPPSFRGAKEFAHLIDLDRARLIQTARSIGVRNIVVDRDETDCQHIDIWGKPLSLARSMCFEEK